MVDQEIRVLGDENIIANPKNSQKQYPLTFKAVPNVIVYGRKKADLNFTVPITEGTNFNFNLERTAIIFSDSFNLEEYSYIMVKNPFEEISDFFYVSSLEELDPTGKEFNEFNDEVVKWLRRLVNIISNRCMIFETTLFKDLNNFPNIKSGQTFIRTEDGWTGITIRDINSELDLIFNKYVEEVNKKIQEHQVKMNELLEQWKKDIQKYAENVKQYEIVRVVTQSGHGFVFEPVMYSISQRKFVKAVFPHGADGIAVRVDDNNFRLVWAGRVEIPATAKDTQQRDFVLGEYYFLGEGSNGGIQREKPDTYYQHLFQVMYSDELQQNIADVLLSVPINQKGKRWDVGEAKTTVNDIEELKMYDFPVGKVVEVLGYYKAGDGANHKRIIKAENDGSGVQLSNNLWANIVHNGEVNVSWFGAKGDGVTDDTEAIKKAITLKTNISFNNKKYYLTDTIDFRHNRTIKGNRCRLIFGNPKNTNYNCVLICSSNILENIDLIITDNNDGILLYFYENREGDGKDYTRRYPSHSVVKNIYLDSNNSNYLGTLLQFSAYSNYGSLFENIRFGRGISEYTKKVKNGFVFDVDVVDGWSTGNIFRDMILDCLVSDYIIKLQGNKKDTSYASSNIFEDIQIQIHGTEYPYLCALKISYMSRTKFVNFKLWDYVKGSCTTGKPIQVDNSGNIKCVNSDITNYVTELVEDVGGKNYNSFRYAENEITFEPESKEYNDLNKAIPIFLPDVSKFYDVSSLEILPLRNFSQESFEGYLKIFSRTGALNVNTTGFFVTYISTVNKSFLKKVIMYKEGIVVWVKDIIRSQRLVTGYHDGIIGKQLTRFNGTKETIDIEEFENPVTLQIEGTKFFTEKLDYTNNEIVQVSQLNTLYHMEKMKQEGVYNDYISYMDEKTLYDKQQRKLEQDKQLAYEEALKENPNLTYEEFMSVQPMTLNLVEEPLPSDALKKFMDKYL